MTLVDLSEEGSGPGSGASGGWRESLEGRDGGGPFSACLRLSRLPRAPALVSQDIASLPAYGARADRVRSDLHATRAYTQTHARGIEGTCHAVLMLPQPQLRCESRASSAALASPVARPRHRHLTRLASPRAS